MKSNKKYNYNYVILFYDVNEKRVHKVFKICKKYLNHFQNSVFRGEITPSDIVALEKELKNIVVKDEDFICLIKMFSNSVFEETIIGSKKKTDSENLFL